MRVLLGHGWALMGPPTSCSEAATRQSLPGEQEARKHTREKSVFEQRPSGISSSHQRKDNVLCLGFLKKHSNGCKYYGPHVIEIYGMRGQHVFLWLS